VKKILTSLICGVFLISCSATESRLNKINDRTGEGHNIFEIIKLHDGTLDIKQCGELWQASPFVGNGQLGIKWMVDIQVGDRRKGAFDIGAYPSSWGVLNPSTGGFTKEFKNLAVDRALVDGEIDEFLFTQKGITDGKYIVEQTYGGSMGTTEVVLKDAKTFEIMRNLPTGRDTNFSFISGALVGFFTDTEMTRVYRLNPSTGEKIWELENNPEFTVSNMRPNNDYVFGSIRNKESGNHYLVRISPEDGSYKTVEIDTEDDFTIAFSENLVWIFSKGGAYQAFDTHRLSLIRSGQIDTKGKTIRVSNYDYNWIYKVDESFLIQLVTDDKPWTTDDSSFILFKTKNQSILELSNPEPLNRYEYNNPPEPIYVKNNSLIVIDGATTKALNPQTLEPIWWIDLTDSDIDNNPRVIWCDWRGVLVMSDTKLVCYNTAE